MPRNMSFSLTTKQFVERNKKVTRRLGWGNMKPGDQFYGCEKAMGLKKGEKVNRLGLCECVSNFPEPLQRMIDDPEYGQQEAILEGFPDMTGAEFVEMFCRHQRVTPDFAPNRIEFKYVEDDQ